MSRDRTHHPVEPGHLVKAKRMRREPTEAEAKLWRLLRSRRFSALKFRRQVPVGRYIVDFLCLEARLVVEADGGQHAESVSDAQRTAWLQANGFAVARYWNIDILQNPEGVLIDLEGRLSSLLPSREKVDCGGSRRPDEGASGPPSDIS